jgi:hypothetical protein
VTRLPDVRERNWLLIPGMELYFSKAHKPKTEFSQTAIKSVMRVNCSRIKWPMYKANYPFISVYKLRKSGDCSPPHTTSGFSLINNSEILPLPCEYSLSPCWEHLNS